MARFWPRRRGPSNDTRELSLRKANRATGALSRCDRWSLGGNRAAYECELPCLLIVDDDQDMCCNLSDIFRDLGYRVETAKKTRVPLLANWGTPGSSLPCWTW